MSKADAFLKKLGAVTGSTYSKKEFKEILDEIGQAKNDSFEKLEERVSKLEEASVTEPTPEAEPEAADNKKKK